MSKGKNDSLDVLDFLSEAKKLKSGVSKTKASARPKLYRSIPVKQRNVYNRIMATSEKKQVLVKVIGSKKSKTGKARSMGSGRKGMSSAKRLSEYLEKDAATDFEMKNGNEFDKSSELVEHIKDEWSPDFSSRKNASDIMHLVVSTPSGSDRSGTLNAAREFGKEFFEKNDYVFVRHDDTHNPHVHFIIKIKGEDGSRLNLGKPDLELARETFAHHAREQGIEVAASRRSWRGAEKAFLKRDSSGVDKLVTSSEHYKNKGSVDTAWVDASRKAIEREASEFDKIAETFESKNEKSGIGLSEILRSHSNKLRDLVDRKSSDLGDRESEDINR